MQVERDFTIARLTEIDDGYGLKTIIVATEPIFTDSMASVWSDDAPTYHATVVFPTVLVGGGWGGPRPLQNPIETVYGPDRVMLKERVSQWASYASLVNARGILRYEAAPETVAETPVTTSVPPIVQTAAIETAAGPVAVTPIETDLVSTAIDTVEQLPEPPNYLKWAVLLIPFLFR